MELSDQLITEEPHFFPCGPLSLAGILTVPANPNGMTVLIPWGNGPYPSSGRNRIRTRMARSLAELGFHSFRFDYQGVGESEGAYSQRDLGEPFSEDIVAAGEWLVANGHSRLIVVGNCHGGWSSLLVAPRIPGLQAVAAINPPVRRDHKELDAIRAPMGWWLSKVRQFGLRNLQASAFRKRLRKILAAKVAAATGFDRADARFATAVRWLVHRQIPLLLVYGRGGFITDFEEELDNGLREVLETAETTTRYVIVDEAIATFPPHTAVLKEVTQWLAQISPLERTSN